MQTTNEIKQTIRPIKRLPSGWPSRGMIRGDVGEYIVLAHADRQPHISKDGINWKQIDWLNTEENAVGAAFERKRWAR